MLNSKTAYIVIAFLLVILFFVWQLMAYKVPEPSYRILKADDNIEIRQYDDLVTAEIRVKGSRYDAINDGFKQLAAYIFGANTAKQKISMTAPVTQQSIKIPMTAPVMQKKSGEYWIVSFVMPRAYTVESLPKPENKNIFFRKIRSKKYVVIQFSGRNTQDNIDSHTDALSHYILKHKLKAKSVPLAAFYNPPWILPFLRRNEIMIEVE